MNPAFAYVYDELLSDSRLERQVSFIETELARRGIEGRVIRLAMFRQPQDTIAELARNGIKNVIFVGNDLTLQRLVWFLPDLDLTIGYLPLIEPSNIAKILGIPVGPDAVDVLAARLIDTFDVGKINTRYFLTDVVIPNTNATVDVEGQYRISPAAGGAIAIRNLGGLTEGDSTCADPQDGYLEGIVQVKTEKKSGFAFWKRAPLRESRVFLRHGTIRSETPMEIFVDAQPVKGSVFELSIFPKKMRMIIGKQKGWGKQKPSDIRRKDF